MRQILGPDALDESYPNFGHFGTIMPARPFLRILQAQARICFEAKCYQESL